MQTEPLPRKNELLKKRERLYMERLQDEDDCRGVVKETRSKQDNWQGRRGRQEERQGAGIG